MSLLLSLLPLAAAPAPLTLPMPSGIGDEDLTRINEIRIDQPSSDNDEYFELSGVPGTSLNGLTYVSIGDGTGGSGVVETAVDLSGFSLDSNGLFLVGEDTMTIATPGLIASLNFENSDNVTHLLVRDFTGAVGDDLDDGDDGMLDMAPWSLELDSVALVEEIGGGDLVYSTTIVGPDGNFVPGHVFFCDDWNIGIFDIAVGLDTAGAENDCPIGTVVCVSEANSTGEICEIGFLSDNTAGAMIDFSISNGPPGEMGYFLAARNFGMVVNPGGYQGVLCAVSDTARFLDSVGTIDVDGNYTATLDTANMPNTPTVPAMAGETWIFQFWYRDLNPTATANFSNALEVTFQ